MGKNKITDMKKRKRRPRKAATPGCKDRKEDGEYETDVSWLWDEPQDVDSGPKMEKTTAFNEREQRVHDATAQGDHDGDEVLPDIDNSLFWPDPPKEEQIETMTALPAERIAAIVVKGCFGLYHLLREHRRRRTRVPAYLLQFARDCEEPLIPAAEVTYFTYYCEGGAQPDNIPDNLYLLGCVECKEVAKCMYHALRLHRLLEAFAGVGRVAQRDFLEVFPAEESRPLMRAMFAEHRLWATTKGKLNPT